MVERYNIHLVGNNPGELSAMNNRLSGFTKANLRADVSFDLHDGVKKITKSKPNYILLDDCYPITQLQKFIDRIRSNSMTRDIPVALLKTSNKSQLLLYGVQDFLLKDSFTGDKVLSAIVNSRKIKRTQRLLYRSFIRTRNRYYSISRKLRQLSVQILKGF